MQLKLKGKNINVKITRYGCTKKHRPFDHLKKMIRIHFINKIKSQILLNFNISTIVPNEFSLKDLFYF
jgi:hypothetical protein